MQYYNTYIGSLEIYLLDKESNRRYGIKCWEVYPKTISPIDLNYGTNNEIVKSCFNAMRIVVLVGWIIYPLGYIFGYLTGGVDSNALNIIYNLADFINKIAFGLVIWAAAMSNTSLSRR